MELFRQMTLMSDEEIAKIHPKHNKSSIKSLIPRLHYFQVDFSPFNCKMGNVLSRTVCFLKS